jgi:hypothetical protein
MYVVGIVMSLLAIVTWLNLASSSPKEELAKLGIIWDGLLTLCYIVVPVLNQARFSAQMGLGLLLIVIGVIVVKGG